MSKLLPHLLLVLLLSSLLSTAAEAERRPSERYRKPSPRSLVLRLSMSKIEPIELTAREYRRMLRDAEPLRRLFEATGASPDRQTWEEYVVSENVHMMLMDRFHGYQEEGLMERAVAAHADLVKDQDWRAAVKRVGAHRLDPTGTGLLGWQSIDELPIDLAQLLFEAEKGEILEPVVSAWGVVVPGVMDIRPAADGRPEQRLIHQLLFPWESFEIRHYNVYAARGRTKSYLRAEYAHASLHDRLPHFMQEAP